MFGVGCRGEHRLAADPALAELDGAAHARVAVVLHDGPLGVARVADDVAREAHHVAVPVGPAHVGIGHSRELRRPVVDLLLFHLAGGGVDGPAPQVRIREVHAVRLPHVLEAGDVEDDLVAVFVGVHRVEHVAGVDVVPLHLGVVAGAGHDAEARRVVLVPADGHVPRHGCFHAEHCGQVHEHHVVLGDVEVVHHRRAAHGDGLLLHQFAVGRHPQVREVRLHERVAERQHLAGRGADLRVRGERALQHTVVTRGTDGLEVAVDHVGPVAFLEGEDLPGVAHHVGVGLRAGHVAHVRHVQDVLGRIGIERRLHVAVAVPLGLAAMQADAVQHPVAEERVVAHTRDGVGPVADIAAVELGWQRAGHDEVGDGALLEHGSTVAPQVDGNIFGNGHNGNPQESQLTLPRTVACPT